MRTLQRLSHARYPDEGQADRLYRAELRAVESREKSVWSRRIQIGCTVALLAALAAWAVSGLLGLRIVVDGLVPSLAVHVRAPARVRVAEVFCRPGEACRSGDPLLRLEALAGKEERRALELAVEDARLRLELVRKGGQLESLDLARRGDLVEQARREAATAEAEYWVEVANREQRVEERQTLLLTLAREEQEREGRILALGQRHAEASALLQRARVAETRAERELGYDERLGASGIAPRVDVENARSELEAARLATQAQAAAVRALEEELTNAQSNDVLGRRRASAQVDQIDAEIKTKSRRIDAALLEAQEWRAIAERREELFPTAGEDPRALAEIELRMLKTELLRAEARLDELDQRLGNVTIRAESDGVVDQLFVSPGAVVEAEVVLMSYFDPAAQTVVAYADPSVGVDLVAGSACRIVPEGNGTAIEGRIVSVGRTWVPCPPSLPKEDGLGADLRQPILVSCPAEDRRLLQPNMRVKVVFRGGAEEEE